jgi:hypothetical protein
MLLDQMNLKIQEGKNEKKRRVERRRNDHQHHHRNHPLK